MSLTAAEIRQQFLDFFKEKNHKIVPSAPIVIKSDPTLLFTNAGMNQFKEYFLGNNVAPDKRIADTQKCLRVSGKHNDLEEVGVDTYHHTMFEMLGNWSFGDYFKKEAIEWSWELLTKVYGIDKDNIYVTVFEGDDKDGLPFDQVAYDEWKKWIAEDRILRGNKKDNFWEMAETGPCGPCSEIHIDCRTAEEKATMDGKILVNADHPQVIEIWNNVFMEFNRLKDGTLEKLPAQHVDTGMGLERLVRVLQGKQSNYDTDLFTQTISETEKIVNKQYEAGDDLQSTAFRVLADHIRAIAFTIADGQLPAANGAGYVIRRILRRAVRYYYTYLDYKSPLLHQLIPTLSAQFEIVFPELQAQSSFVSRVVKEEEEAFLRTLEKGIRRFEDYVSNKNADSSYGVGTGILGTSTEDVMRDVVNQNANIIDGNFAFELYDTYGFPYDLTELIAREQGWQMDLIGFNAAMEAQKNRSRAATTLDTGDWIVINDADLKSFVGYEQNNVWTQVHKYRSINAKGKHQYQIVLNETPFYPEGGGQVGDTGVLIFGEEVINVIDTKRENEQIIHFIEALPSHWTDEVNAVIDIEKRIKTTNNHTATHLVHGALRNLLGNHIQQKGSLVNENLLRFDISHFRKITDEEIESVVKLVNEKIRENIPVIIKELPKDEAIALGAMALFGEKYGETVRTVIIDPDYSIELCGGTHIAHTGAIGTFVIISESAVAAGVRRIEALTGAAAMEYILDKMSIIKNINEKYKTKDPIKTIEKFQEEKSVLEKKLNALEQQSLAILSNELSSAFESIDGVQFLGKNVNVSSVDGLKKMANDLRNKADQNLVVLTAIINDKSAVAVGVSDALAKTHPELNAGKIIKNHIAAIIKGGGGGSPTLATAGGQLNDAKGLEEVILCVKKLL